MAGFTGYLIAPQTELVGGFNHLEKYESQLSVGMIIPYILEK